MELVQQAIENCRLPKFRRAIDECDKHPEIELWIKNLSKSFDKLKVTLCDINFREYPDNTSVVASLLILFNELHSEGPWQTEKVKECLELLNIHFDLLYSMSLDKLLSYNNNNIFNTQEVFDKTMELLHQQLTADNFKKYPALTGAYCSIIAKLKDYDLVVKPTAVMPISLFLIDDYIEENRIKGLQCCSSILQCLTPKHFKDGNYYEVIYGVLKKLITEKDIKVTNSVLECLLRLFEIMPCEAKVTTMDDTLHIVLEQLYVESNLYKKQTLFVFVNNMIPMHGSHCIKRSRQFLTVICDNLDVCSNGSVAEILLENVLECLENWTKYCWCVWRLQPNKKLLSLLLKILYINCENETISGRLQNILITLLRVCSKEDRNPIYIQLQRLIEERKFKECFIEKLHLIINDLNLDTCESK